MTEPLEIRFSSPFVLEDLPDVPASGAPDPAILAEQQDGLMGLYARLHRLTEPYKEVFSLRVFGELSFSQIGELFGKTDSWARLVFYRAKKDLRRGLDEDTV